MALCAVYNQIVDDKVFNLFANELLTQLELRTGNSKRNVNNYIQVGFKYRIIVTLNFKKRSV